MEILITGENEFAKHLKIILEHDSKAQQTEEFMADSHRFEVFNWRIIRESMLLAIESVSEIYRD